MLIRVTTPNVVAGVILDKNKVCVKAAPYFRKWCIGKTLRELELEFRRRGYEAKIIGE